MKTIDIGGRAVGAGHPVFVIAEVGYNFNTIEEAKASIDAAISCGVDAIKFQTFRAETVTSRFTDFPSEAGATNQFDEFKRYELPEAAHRELFEYSREKGIIAFSTPAYFDDVELLERVGVVVHKIGSDDLTNLPFLDYVARKGRPVIFSTGMGNLSEVDEAYRTILAAGNDQIVILQCVSNYPIRDTSVVNLRVIETYRHAFDAVIGFSDHTTSLAVAPAAVALGAAVIERHFTLDKKLPAPDAPFSADPAEMTALVQAIREVESALGNGIKNPTRTEVDMRRETRKSAVARVDIEKGEQITADKFIIKRPGTGIPPKERHMIVGRRARHRIGADEVITWDKID